MKEPVGELQKVLDWILEAPAIHGEAGYQLEKLAEYRDALFSYAKFKIAERVQLAKTPIINEKESWGWIAYKHILVKGALATISSMDYRKGTFVYGLKFSTGGEFSFEEDFVEKAGMPIKRLECFGRCNSTYSVCMVCLTAEDCFTFTKKNRLIELGVHPKVEVPVCQVTADDDADGSRVGRLNRVIDYVRGMPTECSDSVDKKLQRLHDHEGTLRVTWHQRPTKLDKCILEKAWVSVNEFSIEHYFNDVELLST